jgi:hypothetical protein
VPYTILAAVFIVFGTILWAMPIHFRLIYQRKEDDDHVIIDTTALGEIIRYRLKIPVTAITQRKSIPWIESEIESKSGETESHALAEQSKSWLWIRYFLHNPDEMQQKIGRLIDAIHDYADFMRWVTDKIRFERFYWVTRIGLDDAALTAITVGMLWSIKSYIVATLWHKHCCTRAKPVVRVLPAYNREEFHMDFECIFSVRLGHIIGAGIRLLRYKI